MPHSRHTGSLVPGLGRARGRRATMAPAAVGSPGSRGPRQTGYAPIEMTPARSPRRTLPPLVALAIQLIIGAAGLTAPAEAATTPPRPSPTCPPGSTAIAITGSAPTTRGKAEPGVTTLRDGRTVRLTCVPAAPAPMQGPAIAPEHTVGGPALARSGVVVDLPAGVPAPPEMPHAAYVLADLDSGQIIAAKSPHALLRPASTMKTLTALLSLPVLDPKQAVLGDAEDAAAEGTRVGIVPGARYTVDDLFNALLMVSANDAAYAIARVYGGRGKLVADMNTRAAALGAFDTLVVDPSGLDADNQRMSAYDLALIGRAAMALPEFRRRTTTVTATFPGATRTGMTHGTTTTSVVAPYAIANHNPVLQAYPGIIGIKNGYTSMARNTMVLAARREGRTLLLAELGSPIQQTEATGGLLDWGFAYAAQARPVGRLVEPGTAARPPEWGSPDRPASVTTASGETSGPETEPADSVLATPAPSDTGPGPIEYQVAATITSWWSGLGLAGQVGLPLAGSAAAVGAATWWWRRRRAGARGHFQA